MNSRSDNSSESQTDMKPAKAVCFIIQPFGKKKNGLTGENTDNDEVYSALKKLESIDPDFPIKIFRGDSHPVKRENLDSHLSDCFEDAHFCIADVTGQNPNVCYEIGYARAKGLQVIIICQDRKDVPTDLEGLLVVSYQQSDISVLANNITKHFDRVRDDVANKIKKQKEEKLAKIPYLSTRDDQLIRQKILSAKSHIDILQTNLSVLEKDFIDDLVSAMEQEDSLQLRILTLDPQSVFVNYRAKQLDEPDVKNFRTELQGALDNVYFRLRRFERRVQIKTYDDFPSQIAFFFDQEILACVVSATGRSRDNCAFLLPSTFRGAKRSFTDHFSHLWSSETRSHTYKAEKQKD
jgi:glutaredoxin-related protein